MTDVSWNLAASNFRLVTEEGLLLKTEGEISPKILLFMCRFIWCHIKLDWIFFSVLFSVGRSFVIGESLPQGFLLSTSKVLVDGSNIFSDRRLKES